MIYDEVFPIAPPLEEATRLLANSVKKWADAEVMPHRARRGDDADGQLRLALGLLVREVGLGDLIGTARDPDQLRGLAPAMAAVLEQVGRADVGLALLLANTFTLQAAAALHRRPQVQDLLEAGAQATLVLPGYGKDMVPVVCPGLSGLAAPARAVMTDRGWRAVSTWVRPQCAGASAEALAVVCALDGDDGACEDRAPVVLVLPGSVSGLQRGDPVLKTGLASSGCADVRLDGVELCAGLELCAGVEAYRELLCWYYLLCAAGASGALLASWDILRLWSESRVIKGRKQMFRENPLVAQLLGRIGGTTGTGRLLVFGLARLLSGSASSQALFAAAAAVSRQVVGGAMTALDHTMELMASAGYATEWNLERYWRDVKTLETILFPATVAEVDMARHYFGCQQL